MMDAWRSERLEERERMVADQIANRGIRDPRLLEAFRRVPRHRFIASHSESFARAYDDGAQKIGEGQTISQPYIVALMTEALHLTGRETVLEIGAGSGYQTAILAELASSVVAIERHAPLAASAIQTLKTLGYSNVRLIVGDGSRGWPEFAPYDAILVAAVAPEVPDALLSQLKSGGRLVLPVGSEHGEQRLKVIHRLADGRVDQQDLGQVAFVPLVGAAGFGLPEDLGDLDF